MFLILHLIMVHVENNNVCNAHWDNLQGIYDGNNKKQRCLGEKSTLNLHKIKYLICINIDKVIWKILVRIFNFDLFKLLVIVTNKLFA